VRFPSAGFYLDPKRKDPFHLGRGLFVFHIWIFGEDVNVKNIKVPIVLVLVLLAVSAVVSPAQARLNARDGIAFDLPRENRVLMAVALMYAPTPDFHSYWLNTVCDQMTEGGCAYFTDNLESILWQTGQGVTGDNTQFIGVAAKLNDGSQVWKADLTIYRNCGVSKNCKTSASDVYLHVVYDEAQGKWLLNRVLYGPYIDFPKFEEQ
jgi:hypothetical protein